MMGLDVVVADTTPLSQEPDVFFYVSKILWFLLSPPNLLFMLAAVGATLLFTRWNRAGRTIVIVSIFALLLIGFSPLPKLIARPLEDRFPQRSVDTGVDGIIVLGGAIDFARGQVAFHEAGSRMAVTIELAKKHPRARRIHGRGRHFPRRSWPV
jgi:uncharacterized SAM-binding protein YcdF (DUF218 family)